MNELSCLGLLFFPKALYSLELLSFKCVNFEFFRGLPRFFVLDSSNYDGNLSASYWNDTFLVASSF